MRCSNCTLIWNDGVRSMANRYLSLGVEFGSTNIKAVLIDQDQNILSEGSFEWQSHIEQGHWSYNLSEVWNGLQHAYLELKRDYYKTKGQVLKKINVIGISGMMHGYLVFNNEGVQLTPFHTWRDTTTSEASDILSKVFKYHIPLRWSIAQLYQAILNNESYVSDIRYMTTLAGYVHWQLTGHKVIGIGDASGMFPLNIVEKQFDKWMMEQFDALICQKKFPWRLNEILPKILLAGERAGYLTAEGARLIDPEGDLEPGSLFCPPEGDASTGMVATNTVKSRTGNVSAGTSAFSILVLEHPLSRSYKEIDLNATPTGILVANVHCNHCTTDLNAWVGLFIEFARAAGFTISTDEIYSILFQSALKADKECGGIVNYNFLSGEPIIKMADGRPLTTRTVNGTLNLSNFMCAQLFSSLVGLHIGMNILKDEDLHFDHVLAHGGMFKTPIVVQTILASILDTPVSVMKTAQVGGAWGIAVLAGYLFESSKWKFEDWLDKVVFRDNEIITETPDRMVQECFHNFYSRYINGLDIDRCAAEKLEG